MILHKLNNKRYKYVMRKDEEEKAIDLAEVNKGLADSIMSYLKGNNLEHMRISIQLQAQ